MGYRLGVDLGTTYTSAAVARNGHVEPVPLGDHGNEIPSVAYLKPGGGYLVGDAAQAREVDDPDRVAREFKRRLGDRTSLFLGGVPVSAHALTGALLSAVVALVTEREGAPPDHVVLTHPANWGPYRREMFEHAAGLADVRDASFLSEPEAAVLHFGAAGRLRGGDVVAVYDLGGGTFDAALLEHTGEGLHFRVAPEGIEQLGGLDFDAALFGHVVSQLDLAAADPADPDLERRLRRLRDGCSHAKERLSHDVSTSVAVDIPGERTLIRVTRGELEELIAPLVLETIDCLERVLGHAGTSPDELTAVLLVGGSARVPLVRQLLTERLGTPLPPSPQPKLCVAMGAGLHGLTTSPAPRLREPASAPAGHAPLPPAEHGPQPPRGVARGEVARTDGRAASSGGEDDVATRSRSRAAVYAAMCGVLLLAALLTAFVLPASHRALDSNGEDLIAVTGLPEGADAVRFTVLDLPFPAREVVAEADATPTGETDVAPPPSILLAGTYEVQYDTGSTWEQVESPPYVERRGGWGWRLLTVPAVLAVLGAMFSFAYAETLLRGVRRQRGRLRVADVTGMTGVGAILGLVLVVLAWMTGRFPEWEHVMITVALTAASAGLVAFAVSARAERRVGSRATPR